MIWQFRSFSSQGFDSSLTKTGLKLEILYEDDWIVIRPKSMQSTIGILFFPGGGVDPTAYVPLNRALSEQGIVSVIIKLPYKFAPFETNKLEAVDRAQRAMTQYNEIESWIICGHSKGGEIASMLVKSTQNKVESLVLLGTSHPKRFSLANLSIPVKKIYATHDGIADIQTIKSFSGNLPAHTVWVEIKGGNHSQFGYYGSQLGDDVATISREVQHQKVKDEILGYIEKQMID